MNNGKNFFIFSLITLIVGVAATSTTKIDGPKQKYAFRKLVIDAGHGGSDNGAEGKYSNEKTISLQVALKLEQEIKRQMPELEVFMTRTTDIFDDPREKANKANAAKGDLFISIHCNSAAGQRIREKVGTKEVRVKKGRRWITKEVPEYRTYFAPSTAKGTETFIWGVEKNRDKLKAIIEHGEFENDAAMQEEYKKMNDPEQIALISLRMNQYAERSRNLAFNVQSEFVKVGRVDREAKQRSVGIWVLQAVAMPAILVELGFISNPEEEDYLNSEKGQKELSVCIANAVKTYKSNIEAKMQRQ